MDYYFVPRRLYWTDWSLLLGRNRWFRYRDNRGRLLKRHMRVRDSITHLTINVN